MPDAGKPNEYSRVRVALAVALVLVVLGLFGTGGHQVVSLFRPEPGSQKSDDFLGNVENVSVEVTLVGRSDPDNASRQTLLLDSEKEPALVEAVFRGLRTAKVRTRGPSQHGGIPDLALLVRSGDSATRLSWYHASGKVVRWGPTEAGDRPEELYSYELATVCEALFVRLVEAMGPNDEQ